MDSLKVGTRATVGVLIAAFTLAVHMHGAPANEQATRLIAEARQALGGDALLASMHSFTVKGSIRFGSGPAFTYGSFEIACELPDRFVRRETKAYPGRGPGADNSSGDDGSHEISVLGFNGDQIVYEPRWNVLDMAKQPGRLSMVRSRVEPFLRRARQDFARVTLGLFVTSFRAAPVQFVDAPGPLRGTAVGVLGDGVDAILHFDGTTHLPTGVDWHTDSSMEAYRYADYRSVNGMMVPFRVTRARAQSSPASAPRPLSVEVEEMWTVTQFRMNVTIDPKVFRPYAQKAAR